jgi:hypothetical protein
MQTLIFVPFIARGIDLVQFEMACILCLYDETYIDIHLEVSTFDACLQTVHPIYKTWLRKSSQCDVSLLRSKAHADEVVLSDLNLYI